MNLLQHLKYRYRVSSLATLLLLASPPVFGQQMFSADAIPGNLLPHASAVIRQEDRSVTLKSPDEVWVKCSLAVTVLNKTGDEHGSLSLFYNKASEVTDLKGALYDASGKLIRKISAKNFNDESAVSNSSLYEDSRVKSFTPAVVDYPYTVVYEYEMRLRQSLMVPGWEPNPGKDIAVEKSSYRFICPDATSLQIRELHYPGQRKETTEKGMKTYSWELRNILAEREEPYAPPENPRSVKVQVAPVDFSFFKQKGHYTNWNELGKWMFNTLVKPRQKPTPSMEETAKKLAAQYTDKRLLVAALYHYMQQKNRYISVQIGIGGFQPMTAADVDRLGYGDCKALVNYMQTLLNIVQIPSYYCVVEAGNTKINIDSGFASMEQGNHIILAVPMEKDTLWLECTNPLVPAGFLGDFTDDRMVWASSADTSFLLRTPRYTAEQNKLLRKAHYQLDKEGNLSGEVKTQFSGTNYDERLSLISQTEQEQVKTLGAIYPLDNIRFSHIHYDKTEGENLPVLQERMNISLPHYAAMENKRLYLQPMVFAFSAVPKDIRNRQRPLYLNRGYTETDSIVIDLPENYAIELKPGDKYLKTDFGEFRIGGKLEGHTLVFYRQLQMHAGQFAADRYGDYVQFRLAIADADRGKWVLEAGK